MVQLKLPSTNAKRPRRRSSEARLDPITKDTGGCLWMPYSSHLAGPSNQTAKDKWDELLNDENPCRDVREIPFPLRPMDKVDEYALAEGKQLDTTNYDPETKKMAHTMANASGPRRDMDSAKTADFYSEKHGWTGSGQDAKIGVPTTSALPAPRSPCAVLSQQAGRLRVYR